MLLCVASYTQLVIIRGLDKMTRVSFSLTKDYGFKFRPWKYNSLKTRVVTWSRPKKYTPRQLHTFMQSVLTDHWIKITGQFTQFEGKIGFKIETKIMNRRSISINSKICPYMRHL